MFVKAEFVRAEFVRVFVKAEFVRAEFARVFARVLLRKDINYILNLLDKFRNNLIKVKKINEIDSNLIKQYEP